MTASSDILATRSHHGHSQPIAMRPTPLRPVNEPRLRVGVLAACPFPANHGTPGSIRELAEATAMRGHEVHVVTYHFGESIPLDGVHVHRIPARTKEATTTVGPTRRKPLYDLQMVFKAIDVIRRHRLDVLHAHGYEAALVAALARLVTGRPIVYSAHNSMGDELASYNFFRSPWFTRCLAWLLDRYVPRVGDRCLPHSHNLKTFLTEQGLAHRTEPILNFGINLDTIPTSNRQALRSQYGLGDEPVILYSGVMDHFQRLDLLLQAMQPVLREHPTAKLVLVVTIPCDAHQQRLQRQIAELGIERQVIFTPPQDLSGAMKHLYLADVAVVPRPAAPGFPIKLLNYMATGRACVMFASSASGLEHGKHAWLVQQDTSEALGHGINRVLADANFRSRLAEKARQFVQTHHDRYVVAGHLVQTYQRALEGSRYWSEVTQRPCVTELSLGNRLRDLPAFSET